jgi:hypothetical protein
MQPERLQVYSQERSTDVPKNPDPDETIVMDLSMARMALVDWLQADGEFSPGDAETVRRFDEPIQLLSVRTKAKRAFDSLMRNGYTRYTAELADDAEIAIVIDAGTRQVADVLPFPTSDPLEAA